MNLIVDIADMVTSDNKDDVLVTYSLGSCLGISIYDPVACVGGLMHCMLPLAKVDPVKAKDKPYMFVDSGMSTMLNRLFKMGLTRKNAIIKVAGGARVIDKSDMFKIGERNFTIFRKILWKNGMMLKAHDVGGGETRTVRLIMATGEFLVKTSSGESSL